MPNCNIIGCGVKKSGKHPNLTLHRLPTNKIRRKIWLDTIGIENIKMSTKRINICSLHFKETCFNRTLNKVTLRDEAVPSRTLLPVNQPNMSSIYFLIEGDQNQKNSQSISRCDALNMVKEISKISGRGLAPSTPDPLDFDTSTSDPLDFVTSTSTAPDLAASTSAAPGLPASTSAAPDLPVDKLLIRKLKDKCQKQSKKIKRLNEKIRKQNKIIAHLSNINNDLRGKKFIKFKIPTFACGMCRTPRLLKKISCKIQRFDSRETIF